MPDELERAVDALAGVRRLVVVTGAGMSQDSGVPTFRDALTGLWSRYDPQELATETAFRRNPARVFGWYLGRWRQVRQAVPHAGHHALARMRSAFDELLVATQNVDGLHLRAGSREVVELHGSLEAFRCLDGGHPYDADQLEDIAVPVTGEVEPPACRECGSPIRPGVVWFGEMLPALAVERAWSAAKACDAVLVVGTSAIVYPVAELPLIALRGQRPVIEINPERTPLSSEVHVWWSARAAIALPLLADRIATSDSVL